MPRNAEVIRQWTILREIEQARGSGVTIDDLAALCDVTTRTIRRDLQALEEAGFPLYDDKSSDDGKTRWRYNGQAFKGLAAGLTVSELCALYFSRTLVEVLAATPFQQDVASAFDKLATALTPGMRQFLDRLPLVFQAKGAAEHADKRAADHAERKWERERVARLLDATLNHRRATMKYFSMSSGREKAYVIEPYRLVYSPGGLYVLAFVPDYGELRTFAVGRIRNISLLEGRFTPSDLPEGVFAHSLGVNQGPPEHIEIGFEPRIAPYVRERRWHPSQKLVDRKDGGVALSLDVCNDWALRSWILGFGRLARVIAPASLKAQIKDEIDRASERYSVE